MAGWLNYRVKVDLSKYHQDVRRFSWIYINSSNIWLISHLKQHIVDVFGIQEPFHLLLNGNEYLPPAEDVRVLTENEIIAVEPGSGMLNRNVPKICMSAPVMEDDEVKAVQPTRDANTDHHIPKYENQKGEENGNESFDDSIALYRSMLNVTGMKSYSYSNPKDDGLIPKCSAIESNKMPPLKRRRIRRRKTPNPVNTALDKNISERSQPNCNKPTIIDSYTLPAGKHIRFDDAVETKTYKVENEVNNITTEDEQTRLGVTATSRPESTSDASLTALLALRKCSSPLIFVSKKMKDANCDGSDQPTDVEHTTESSNAQEDIRSLQNAPCNTSNNITQITEGQIDYLHLNLEEYPNLQATTQVNDIIAFKILRIGNEYTPEVSGYIVAKTVGWCPEKMLYSFQILEGRNEIQPPLGKFSISEDVAENEESDTAQFKFDQLINPRLINRQLK